MIAAPLSFLLLAGALQQGTPVRGVVYDSLLRAPLGGAEVWLRGTERRALTDADGRFEFDSVAAGRYVLAVSHPGLDSAGFYTIASPITVTGASGATPFAIATPSLATVWRRRCGVELALQADSGIVFGVVQDVATKAHLAGAALIVSWLRLVQIDNVNVRADNQTTRASTDSIGVYYACGVATDMTLGVRAYAGTDSTGLIDVRVGARRIGRQDLTISLAAPPTIIGGGAAPTGTPSPRQPASLFGTVLSGGKPLLGARAGVRESETTSLDPDGTFLLTGLPAGTQWVTVQSIGSQGTGQAVDLKGGETTSIIVTLTPLPVTLDPVQVTSPRSRQMAELQERRRLGMGYVRTEAELTRAKTMRGVFTSFPSVQIGRGRANADFIVLLPRPGAQGRGYCVASLFLDGFRSGYDQLSAYRPEDLAGVEVYIRPAEAPIQYQSVSTGCGVVLVWTKYVESR